MFSHTVAAVVADAFDYTTYAPIAEKLCTKDGVEWLKGELDKIGKLELVYWLCFGCVDQHGAICDGLTGCRFEKDTVSGMPYETCNCTRTWPGHLRVRRPRLSGALFIRPGLQERLEFL